MRSLCLQVSVFLLMCIVVSVASAQNANDFRTVAGGNWNSPSIWERYSGSAWEAAVAAPDSGVAAISIDSSHTVTVTSDVAVDSVTVVAHGSLAVNPGVILTIAFNNDWRGLNVDTLANMTVSGTVRVLGRLSGADSSIVFSNGSIYDHARNGGSVPRAVWQDGSTIRLTGVTANSPSNMNQNFYDLEIDCPGLTANLNMGMSGNTIRGDITVLTTGSNQRYYLTAPNAYVNPITILGGIRVLGGAFSSNGSSSAASIVVHTYGNVIVTSGNFGCSRGSGTNVSWYLYGDSMIVSNATLQNSTSSPTRIQKFIFAKQGVQYLRWSNVTYGGTGTSPITLQVGAGTTLDIGTTHIPNGNTGSFILDSSATLVSTHNGPGDEGNIECLADLGGGNSFVNVNATAGSGNVSVTATKGAHPNIYDPNKTLQRYWTISADPGITQATMILYYYDLDTAGTEVRGDETQYKALKYAGTGTNWFTESASTADNFFDFVTAPGIAVLTGVWTVGETAPTPNDVPVTGTPEIPQEFFVDQNYPNPFNPTTTIAYGLPTDAYVKVRVYNLLGQEVANLFEGKQTAGVHELKFDGGRLSSGVYLYRVQAGDIEKFKQMILLK